MLGLRQLERVAKGYANHRRIQVLQLLEKSPELSVLEISLSLKMNYKTASEHIRRLTLAGLIFKRNQANNVLHHLSPRGSTILKFLRTLE